MDKDIELPKVERADLTDLFGDSLNDHRLKKVSSSQFLLDEIKFVTGVMNKGITYYRRVMLCDIDRSNVNNSYIMWLYDRVDVIDMSKGAKKREGSYSLPDIDMDFPPGIREDVLAYIREKYGHDKVCQMITLGRLQGRSIIQEVLRVNGTASPGEIFTITKRLPKEDKISDKLAEMDKPSVIRWVLEHDPKLLSDYVYLEDGKVCGERAADFEQALRLEGTFKATGIHAAGVIVSARPLDELVPLIRSKGSELVGGMEMGDLEALGAVKLDVLGVAVLEKIMKTVVHAEGGKEWITRGQT